MSQWNPDQPAVHPDHPPAPVDGPTVRDDDIDDLLATQVLIMVRQVRDRISTDDLPLGHLTEEIRRRLRRVETLGAATPDMDRDEIRDRLLEIAAVACRCVEDLLLG